MSTHNICFRGEIRKIFTRYPLLSRPMELCSLVSVLVFLYLGSTAYYIYTMILGQTGLSKQCLTRVYTVCHSSNSFKVHEQVVKTSYSIF